MRGRVLFIGVCVIAFMISSCSQQNDFEKLLKEGHVLLRYEQSRNVSSNLFLKLEEITDSRCPVGAVCENDGRVLINIRASISGEVKNLSFNVCGSCGEEGCIHVFENHRIKILSVFPYPSVNYPIEDINDYLVEILVEEL